MSRVAAASFAGMVGLVIGAIPGFLVGQTFAAGARPDWSAIAAVATAAAVIVALLPIHRDRARRQRLETFVRQQLLAGLRIAQVLIETSDEVPDEEADDAERRLQLVAELNVLVGKLELLDPVGYRRVVTAVAGLRVLVMTTGGTRDRLRSAVVKDVEAAIEILACSDGAGE